LGRAWSRPTERCALGFWRAESRSFTPAIGIGSNCSSARKPRPETSPLGESDTVKKRTGLRTVDAEETGAMRDDDRLLDLPEPEFGSGVVGVCDVCGERQAVVVLTKERFKLCVLDFLNKTWIKTDKKPGVPAPLYRSERVWFETDSTPSGKAQGILLSPTKIVKHPTVLITPDVYGITTTVLDAGIRFAREGFEVLMPDVGKIDGIGPRDHLALRSGARFRGGIPTTSRRVGNFTHLYADAFDYLRDREMVDPGKSAVFGTSYGASLALALAARDTRLSAVVLAYPVPVRPADLGKLVTAPLLFVAGSKDSAAARARQQLESARTGSRVPFEFMTVEGVRHDFLSRDLSSYDLPKAEETWARILAFLKQRLMPPPPRPPPPPVARPDPIGPAAATPSSKAAPPPVATPRPTPAAGS
jgi:carboxymethylenebutenolidase